jgi:transcriptional antiterminator NusG
MTNWCVLFVKTGSEQTIIKRVKLLVDISKISLFLLSKERYIRRFGVKYLEKIICFPGYIFIETALSADEMLMTVWQNIKSINNVYRLLKYSEKHDIFIRRNELTVLRNLCPNSYCIKNSIGIIVGDTVRVKSGPLVGMESSIKKIDRHKREALIELNLFGDLRRVSVALDVVEKI